MDTIELKEKSKEEEGKYEILPHEDKNLTTISQGVIVAGKIQSARNLVIQGEVRGYAVAGGKINISDTGIVEGVVVGKDINIIGQARGKIQAEKALVITCTASVSGDFKYAKLHIEDGAHVNNKIHLNLQSTLRSEDSQSSNRLETFEEEREGPISNKTQRLY